MKSGKVAGQPGIVVEMLKVSGAIDIDLVMELANSIMSEGVVPVDCRREG